LGLTPKDEYEMGINAFGGVLWILRQCLIDSEILSMKNFEIYNPDDEEMNEINEKESVKKPKQKYMVIFNGIIYK
jgi:hypothetical protein